MYFSLFDNAWVQCTKSMALIDHSNILDLLWWQLGC